MVRRKNQIQQKNTTIEKTKEEGVAGDVVESQTSVIAQQYRGPLPDPNMLAQFEDAHPGLAERIVTAWEKEAKHRHGLESRDVGIAENLVGTQAKDTARGQYISGVIALSGVVATVFMAVNGVGAASLGTLSTLIVPIISYLVTQRKIEQAEKNGHKKKAKG